MLPTSDRHSHKHKQKSALYGKQAGPFIVFFTVLMPTNCVVLEQYYFDLKLDPITEKIQGFLIYFVYLMAMWSYYQAIMIKNDCVDRPPPPPDNRAIDPIYKNSGSCNQCNKWKPVRAHHCSLCGQCVLKMDHHCPWINNCVGLRNHRAFYLFTMYMTIGAIQYSWGSWVYFKQLFSSTNGFFSQQTTFFYLYWAFTSLVLYPTCAMLCFLFFYHSTLILNNQTTLEQMKSRSNSCCCFTPGAANKNINVFDRGLVANIAWFFNYSYFWFLPFANIYDTDGTSYPMAPLCTFEDVRNFDPTLNDTQAPNSQFDFDQIDSKFEEYLKQAKDKYKGKKIVLNGQEIQLE